MINTLLTTDIRAKLGDGKAALRGLWADLAQKQTEDIDPQTIAAFVMPENFAPQPKKRREVTLKRTFNMEFGGTKLKFWRITGPATHPNYQSDLSIQGLRDWGVL